MTRALGTDDSVNTCDCCGKTDLKFTVAIELDNGEIVHYGQVCAGRNTGKTRPQINAEMKAHAMAQRAAARAEYFASPAYLAERARFAERDRLQPRLTTGLASAEFVREARDAADAVCRQIAKKYGLSPYEVS